MLPSILLVSRQSILNILIFLNTQTVYTPGNIPTAYLPGEKRAYRKGETVAVVLRVRNFGKEEVKFSYFHEEFRIGPTAVTDDGGRPVPLAGVNFAGVSLAKRLNVTLAPGTIKNATIEEVNEKAVVVSVSFGNKEKPTKLVNVRSARGVRVVASHVLYGVANNLPFEWKYVETLKGKVVSLRLLQDADGLVVVSIASGND